MSNIDEAGEAKKKSVSDPTSGTENDEEWRKISKELTDNIMKNPEYAFERAQKEYEKHERNNNKEGMAFFLEKLGDLHMIYGSQYLEKRYYDQALEVLLDIGDEEKILKFYLGRYDYEKALEIYEKRGDLKNIAVCYEYLDELEKALEIYKQLNDDSNVVRVHFALAFDEKDIEKSKESFEEQLELLEGIGAEPCEYSIYYENMASKYEMEGDFNSAIETFKKIIEMNKLDEINSTHIESLDDEPVDVFRVVSYRAGILRRIGKIYALMEEYDKAHEYYNEVFQLTAQSSTIFSEWDPKEMNLDMGMWELERKNYGKAVEYFERAVDVNKKHCGEASMRSKELLEKAIQLRNWHQKYKEASE